VGPGSILAYPSSRTTDTVPGSVLCEMATRPFRGATPRPAGAGSLREAASQRLATCEAHFLAMPSCSVSASRGAKLGKRSRVRRRRHVGLSAGRVAPKVEGSNRCDTDECWRCCTTVQGMHTAWPRCPCSQAWLTGLGVGRVEGTVASRGYQCYCAQQVGLEPGDSGPRYR